MIMLIILMVAACVLLLLGLIGCVAPILPGPPLSWLGLLLLRFTSYGENLNTNSLIGAGIFAALVTVLDYVLPVWTTRKFGGSKYGVWGATIGLVLGIFCMPPLGLIVGPFAGALVGEYLGQRNDVNPWRSALGSFVGFLLGTGAKLAVSGYITYLFAQAVFA
ncbi:MAG: DUF456 domain-containing protein [Bacteroidales bacterium]|nr:DUF456 domain-containing protein [Bacteroidales bacterium]